MSAPPRRLISAFAATALTVLGTGAVASAPASATTPVPSYTIAIGATGSYAYADDTPASSYIDKDGTFYFQESHSLYGANDPRQWSFYTGKDFDSATLSDAISNAVNPANPDDGNGDTTWRCNNSPTGLQSSYAPKGSGYAQKNYCDLVGVWVDPDTGNWYGLVHNEFTPQPFGDGLHYDSIDYAVSTDQGKTWSIQGHAITSPYSTTRGDDSAFPNQTYDYGDGDPRLFVDTASGYFYVYYGSRIIPKGGVGGGNGGLAHVARAPISGKMAAGSWQKWYDGKWSQPGVGGLESNMVPVTPSTPTGYTPPAKDYNPANTGSVDQQIASGELPSKSQLFIMNISYDAYLGLYIGEPEVVSGTEPQQFYATKDLATQKWSLIGDSGSYTSSSWYRWMMDKANGTDSTVIGKTFRSYCAISCAGSDGEYADITIGSSKPAAPPVDLTKTYRIRNTDGRVLAQPAGTSTATSLAHPTHSAVESWSFLSDGDGSYRVVNAASGQLLGVDSTSTAGRAWGAGLTVTGAAGGNATVGQQWFILRSAAKQYGGYQLVNRYSGLVIGMSGDAGRLTETTPARSWTDTTGGQVGGGRTAAEQTLTFTATGTAPEAVVITGPGDQSGAAGKAVSVQLTATDNTGKPLTFSATGLPAGLSISSSGLITGTPSAAGVSTVTVTASSGTAGASASFSWTVAPDLSGNHTLTTGGKALDDANGSTTAANQLTTWSASGGSDQRWQFVRQPDGSYELVNGTSQMCADVSGGSTDAGAQVIQWPCSGAANQHWNVKQLPNGSYTVSSAKSGLLLTTASTSDGAMVTQQPDTGSPLQQWSLT
ncbi:RICIN domain-containing protein [Kitasatospora sp. RB6PN24]|uniref:RICIN domain-containing protein n=1 Tax=Kitasatospora humi TaxID=2893891 RepID=UPI001E3A4F3E|nr:RICIN domain-containing protein [Kitasatospora humi]MCC9306031.1 RICIN domain-containing protein [Kitasatospora humi]